jgi:hypothetical protein
VYTHVKNLNEGIKLKQKKTANGMSAVEKIVFKIFMVM